MVSNNFSTNPYFGNAKSRSLHEKLLKRTTGPNRSVPSYPLNANGSSESLIKAYADFVALTPQQIQDNADMHGKPRSKLYQLVQNAFYWEPPISKEPHAAHEQMKQYVPDKLLYRVQPFSETSEEKEARLKAIEQQAEQQKREKKRLENMAVNKVMRFLRLNPNRELTKDDIVAGTEIHERRVSDVLSQKILPKKQSVIKTDRDHQTGEKSKFKYIQPNHSTGSLIQ